VQGVEDGDRVYTLRLRTGFGRDAGIRAPNAGVLVCLVGKDGAATLHRVGPLYDAESTERELQAICQAWFSTLAAVTHTGGLRSAPAHDLLWCIRDLGILPFCSAGSVPTKMARVPLPAEPA